MCRLVRTYGSAFRGITFSAVDALAGPEKLLGLLRDWFCNGECEDPVSHSGCYLFGGHISVHFLFFWFSAVEFRIRILLRCRRLCRVCRGAEKTCI